MPLKYHEKIDKENTIKLRSMQRELPAFCQSFFRGIEPRTQSRTRIAYAYDLKVFFQFMMDELGFKEKYSELREIQLQDLDELKVMDLESYMEHLKYRTRSRLDSDGNELQEDVLNQPKSIKRKISSLKSFYNYLYRDQLIGTNPAALLSLPKLHEQDIIRLDDNELASFLDEVESGSALSVQQQKFHAKTALRDSAIMTLMLGTGIRVSECVGLNIQDVDFNNDGIRIHRKGGKEVTVYFSDEVERTLAAYIEERKRIPALSGSEDALFLSLQNKRISVRTVEKMVKKYAAAVTPLKHITPHKLRSTYGTNLYKETGDIYLVADVLGHSDVNTTKKHYAALEDERRRSARNKVRLRED